MTSRRRLPFWIYLAGIFPLAYWQDSVRALLGDWLSFAAVIGYLLFPRLLGFWGVRLLELRQKRMIAAHNHLIDSKKQRKHFGKT